MTEERRLVRSAGVMSVMTLLSRIFGYLRDLLLAQYLGASRSADAFIIAFRIPNLLRRLVGEGAFTAAFVPTLSGYAKQQDRREIWRFAAAAFWTMAIVLVILSALGVIFSPFLVKVLAYGFGDIEEKWNLTVSLNRLMFPYLVFIGLAALIQGVLNVHDSFGVPAFTPVLLNLSIIGAALGFAGQAEEPAYVFAWGVLFGGALQLGFQIPFVVRLGMRFRPRLEFGHPGVRKVGRLMLPGLFGMGIVQITILVDSFFASLLPEGSVSALYYSGRVNELALGAFAISISTVILPTLSRHAAAGRMDELGRTMLYGLRVVAFITLPSAIGLAVLREPIIATLFERGRFDPTDTAFAARALLFYAVGLYSFGAVKVAAPAFYSQMDTRTPAMIAAYTLVIHIVVVAVLSRLMAHAGIALADSISATVNMSLLLWTFARRHPLAWARGFFVPWFRYLGAAALMGIFAFVSARYLAESLAGSLPARLLALGSIITLSGAVYGFTCFLMGSGELRDLLDSLPLPGRKR